MMKKIAIWSSYNYGNFGDDLMAVEFAREVLKNGGTPIVYRLDKRVADFYCVQTTTSIRELLDGTHAVIIGGGALFTRETWLRTHFRKVTRSFETDFRELLQGCEKANIPIYPLSIGGDGGGSAVGIPKWHRKLFSSELCTKGTVRLPDCLTIAESFHIQAEYHADVVFAASYCFKVPSTQFDDGLIHIGVNLKKTDTELINVIREITSEKNNSCCFHFIRTHLSGYPLDYEYLPESETKFLRFHLYENLDQTIGFFASLELLLTVKLHIGVTALSVGTPFISYNGKDKTKSLLTSIGAESCIYTEGDLEKLKLFLSTLRKGTLGPLYDFAEVEKVKQDARSHLQKVAWAFA